MSSSGKHLWLLPVLGLSLALAPALAAQQPRQSDGPPPCYQPPGHQDAHVRSAATWHLPWRTGQSEQPVLLLQLR